MSLGTAFLAMVGGALVAVVVSCAASAPAQQATGGPVAASVTDTSTATSIATETATAFVTSTNEATVTQLPTQLPTPRSTSLPTPTPTVRDAASVPLLPTLAATNLTEQPEQPASPLPSPTSTLTTAFTGLLSATVPIVPGSVDPGPVAPIGSQDLLSPTMPLEGVIIHNQMTISMATMARSFIQILQEPIGATGDISTTAGLPQADIPPLFIITPMSVVVPLTDTHLPPLPVEQSGGMTVPAAEPAATPAPLLTQTPLQPDGVVRTVRVPILMYHYLSEPPPGADIYRRDLSLSPARFAAHLARIRAEGYTVISLYELVAHLMQGAPLPSKPVVLTFDDGYRDNYENAFPLLREQNMTATFFVVMEFINQERPEYLTWAMVDEMAAAGMDFQVHGIDHTTLRERTEAELEFQALRGYETLQNRLGTRPRFISYPAGEYDQQTMAIFQRAGYWAGLTTIQGATHSSDALFELRRVRIRNTTTADELARLLALDW